MHTLFHISLHGVLPALALIIASVAQAADTGLLWKVEAANAKTSYLFGTMHSDDKRLDALPKGLDAALASSEAFMIETLPPRDPGIFLLQDNQMVSSFLNDAEVDKLRELADFHSMHTEAALRMKPWLLAVIFDLPKPQTPFSMDAKLMTKAEQQGKRVFGLEDTDEHFGVLDSFSMDEQIVMLRAVLKRSQKDKQRDFEALIKAYKTGDIDNILKRNEKITGDMLPAELWDRMRFKLIDERNVRMAERIARQAEEVPVFVAVGASHLGGKGGLVERLREAGYQVTAVK
ncbi:TraB/GumN family protein [Methylobacillus flagellatus]|uniref:TraB/GumN family protein n=1 Tax=Methylobacillus flagellatus TaxID=405 RepID=UPI0010F91330|nr:TraB/GumN family protein [Methylobacillus flagellatus]